MNNLFIDTDVIIDFLADRKPFSREAAVIFSLAEQGIINLYASSLTFSNLYYVLCKFENKNKVIEKLERLSELFKILNVDEKIIKRSLKSKMPDFEASIQYHCAQAFKHIDLIITRNIKDFKDVDISVMTPGDFLKIAGSL